jgi:amino acid transporter
MTSIGTLVAFIVVSIGVIVLRRTAPDLPRGFKVPGYPVTPILSVVGCLVIIYNLRPITIAAFVVWTLVVLVWYFAWGIKHSELGRAERERAAIEDGTV